MPDMKLNSIIIADTLDSYLLFREIEDWCLENIPRDKWRFCYASPLCVQGVDLPGRIIFRSKDDLHLFNLRFMN